MATWSKGRPWRVVRSLDRQCAQSGHRLTTVAGSPSRLYCSACERTFDLVPVEAS